MEFEREHVGRADDLIASADDLIASAEDRAQTASYSRAFQATGLASPRDCTPAATATRLTLDVGDHYVDHGLPPLDALLVQCGPAQGALWRVLQGERHPGSGYGALDG
jgi:hypothetical protein